ncbi:MerR family transcriptional regulator [Mameliella sp.]|uniref:MerR family transcriptional regulator n=1 Tax=Mameliella sp. TaxID=1924940 RepID=UPI003B511F6B
MPKSRDAFRTISEVAEWLDTPAHVLRFWESKFTQVKPVKRAGGRRYYRPADMELLGGIKRLLHDDGMTIKGVQKVLREQGVRHVAALASQPVDEDATKDDGALIEDAPYAEVPLQEEADSVVAFPGEHLQQQSNGMPTADEDLDGTPENDPEHDPDDAQDTAPEAAPEAPDDPAAKEPDEKEAATPELADVALAADDLDDKTESLPDTAVETGESPTAPINAEHAPAEEEAIAGDETEDAEPVPQSGENTPDSVTATDTAPTPKLWGDSDAPELPFDLAPPARKPSLPDDLLEALHSDTAEVLEPPDPEDTPDIPAETAPVSAGLDLPDFAAGPEVDPVPSPPTPAIGPLGQLARIRSLTPDQRAALSAQLPALKARHDRLSTPLS